MKKILGIFGLLFVVLLFFGMIYTLFHIWSLFGIWRVIALFVVTSVFIFVAYSSKLQRTKTETGIIYNPNELPLYIATVVGFGTMIYFFTILQGLTDVSSTDYFLALLLLGMNALQFLTELGKTFLNRNDQVELTSDGVQWIDMENGADQGAKLAWSDIQEIEGAGKFIIFTLKDESVVRMVPEQMNMGSIHLVESDITEYFEQYGSPLETQPEPEEIDVEAALDEMIAEGEAAEAESVAESSEGNQNESDASEDVETANTEEAAEVQGNSEASESEGTDESDTGTDSEKLS